MKTEVAMERIQPMNELQIQEKVEDLAGKTARILDCEQNTMNQTEEILLVNGIPISLAGDEGARIKEALIHGEVPHSDLVNGMLIRAGIETNPVELETTMNVKTSAKVLEHSTLVDRNGVLVDEKMREKEDQDEFNTVNVEIWRTEHNHPTVGNKNLITDNKKVDNKKKSRDKGKDKDSVDETKSKKHSNIFSPSSIIKGSGDKNKGKSKSSKSTSVDPVPPPSVKTTQSQQQIQQQQAQQPPAEINKVSKNKFFSLFLKGKTKEKDGSKDKTSETKTKNKSDQEKNNDKQTKNKNTKGVGTTTTVNPSLTKKQNINVNYLDPSLSLVHVEIDGIPVRVAYETFV